MKRDGFLTLTLRSGVAAAAVPAHLDCLTGAGRPSPVLDGGRIDALVRQQADGARFRRIFHARRSLGRPGEHHVGFDDQEEALGLSRTYQVELAQPDASVARARALRDLRRRTCAACRRSPSAPLDAGPAPARARRVLTRDEALHAATSRARARGAGTRGGRSRPSPSPSSTPAWSWATPSSSARCLAGYDTVDLGLGRLNEPPGSSATRAAGTTTRTTRSATAAWSPASSARSGFRVPRGASRATCMLLPVRVLAAALRDKPAAA